MTNFVPIFPMEIVVYPAETIDLPVTSSTYKELVRECYQDNKPLGIPVLREGKAMEYGTSAEILGIKEEEDEVWTVTLKGARVFRILEFIKDLPDKHFSGAIVSYPENDTMKVHPNLSNLIITEVKRLYSMLNIENLPDADNGAYNSYQLAHRLGLTREQEYELLCIFNEVQRMEYLRRYFNAIMPEIDDVDLIKSRINLN